MLLAGGKLQLRVFRVNYAVKSKNYMRNLGHLRRLVFEIQGLKVFIFPSVCACADTYDFISIIFSIAGSLEIIIYLFFRILPPCV